MKSSRSSRRSQTPCFEMFVISAAEVLVPSIADLLVAPDDHFASLSDLSLGEPVVASQFAKRIKPELRFAVGGPHMNVRARLFAREEVVAESAFYEDCRTHNRSLPVSPNGL